MEQTQASRSARLVRSGRDLGQQECAFLGPTEKTIKRLFALSGNLCAFPGCSLPIVESAGTITGEICHIHAQKAGGPRFDSTQTEEDRHGFDKLILLCRRHHRIVDSQPEAFSAEALEELKKIREKEMGRPEQATDAFFAKILLGDLRRVIVNNDSGNVIVDSPGAVQAHTVNVRTTRKALHIQPAAGTIGADQEASRYVQYLISRYNQFASADRSRATTFSYGAISKNVEKSFGAPWRMLAIEDFEPVCAYLQQRIGKTRIAKSNLSKGARSFTIFADFGKKSGDKG